MRINYADTVTMYFTFVCTKAYTPLIFTSRGWRFNNNSKKTELQYWFIDLDVLYVAFYPNMYGVSRLFVTFSVPKLLKGSNTYNIINFSEENCYRLVMKELNVFPWVDLACSAPKSFVEWQISRLDLFIMHRIPVGQREDYKEAYELLTLPRYRSVKYENTCYINSSFRPDKKSNKVFRIYPKLKEIQDRLGVEYPSPLHKKHELYLETMDTREDLYRFEIMLRRTVLCYECKKAGVQPNVHEVFEQKFQENIINKMISILGVDRKILNRREYLQAVTRIFKTNKVRGNAIIFARCVRNKQSPPLSQNQISKVKRELKQNGIHFVTHRYISLVPVQLRNVP